MPDNYGEYDPYGNNAYPEEWGTGLPQMNISLGESLGAGTISGLADLALPAMAFTAMMGSEFMGPAIDERLGRLGDYARKDPNARGIRKWLAGKFEAGEWDPRTGLRRSRVRDMAGLAPGARAPGTFLRMVEELPVMGKPLASMVRGVGKIPLIGGLARGGVTLGGMAAGAGLAILPYMAIEKTATYLAENIMEGAESYYHSNRMMEQIGSMGSTFGAQSILDDQSGFSFSNIRSWTMGGGIESIKNTAKTSDLGREGITNLAGSMVSQGMVSGFSNPEEFMTKFRAKLQQVQQLSKTLDVSIAEATQVMSAMGKAGISAPAQIQMGQYAGTIASLTGQSYGAVMSQGLEGAQMAVQMGLTADQGMGMAMSNLSSMSTLSNLGALDPGVLARAGGASGLANQLTQYSMQMSRTYGGQRLLARMVNEEGTDLDLGRLGEVAGGGRPSRRRLDPYAMDDLAQDFRENEGSIVLGQLSRLRVRHGEGNRYNREQYQFLSELGIEDPQEQLTYLQNLRTAPIMSIIEANQQGRDVFSQQGALRTFSNNNIIEDVGDVFKKIGDALDVTVGEAARQFGQRFAQLMERVGEDISTFFNGRRSLDQGMVQVGTRAISDFARTVYSGNFDMSYSSTETAQFMLPAELDNRGWLGTNALFGNEADTRITSQIAEMMRIGQISQRQARNMGIGIWNARGLGQEERNRLERRGLLGSRESFDAPGVDGGQALMVFNSPEGRRDAIRMVFQQGVGGSRRDVDYMRRELEGEYGNTLRDRFADAAERSSQDFYTTVGAELGYGRNFAQYNPTDMATIEQISQRYLEEEVRENAHISARGYSTSEMIAMEARWNLQATVESLAGVGNRTTRGALQETEGQRVARLTTIRETTPGMTERQRRAVNANNIRARAYAQSFSPGGRGYSSLQDTIDTNLVRINDEERRRDSDFSAEINTLIGTDRGRETLGFFALEAAVEHDLGIDIGYSSGERFNFGLDVESRRFQEGRVSTDEMEDLMGSPWMSDDLRGRFRREVGATGRVGEVTRRELAEEQTASRRSPGDRVEAMSTEEQEVEISRLLAVFSASGTTLTASQKAHALSLAGFNVTNPQHRELVTSTVGRSIGTAFGNLAPDGDRPLTWGDTVRRQRDRSGAGISDALREAIETDIGSNGMGLISTLNRTEASTVSSNLAKASEEAFGPMKEEIERGWELMGLDDEESVDARYLLDILAGDEQYRPYTDATGTRDIQIQTTEDMANNAAMLRRSELIAQRREELGLRANQDLSADEMSSISTAVESFRQETLTRYGERSDVHVSREQRLFSAGAALTRDGGFNAIDQDIISRMGPGSEDLIRLGAMVNDPPGGRSGQREMERLLSSEFFSGGILAQDIEKYVEAGQNERTAIASLSRELLGGDETAQQRLSDITGRAVAGSFLNPNMIEAITRREDAAQRDRRIGQIADGVAKLANTVTEGNLVRTRAS